MRFGRRAEPREVGEAGLADLTTEEVAEFLTFADTCSEMVDALGEATEFAEVINRQEHLQVTFFDPLQAAANLFDGAGHRASGERHHHSSGGKRYKRQPGEPIRVEGVGVQHVPESDR